MTIRKSVLLAFVSALVFFGSFVCRAEPALAVTCYGYSCHGHDPIKYGCPVSSTVTTYGKFATVWNRYSKVCNANWARAQLTPAGIAAGYQFLLEAWTTDSKNNYEHMCEPWQNDSGSMNEPCTDLINIGFAPEYTSVWYTDMLDGTHTTTASVVVYASTDTSWPYAAIAQYNASQ